MTFADSYQIDIRPVLLVADPEAVTAAALELALWEANSPTLREPLLESLKAASARAQSIAASSNTCGDLTPPGESGYVLVDGAVGCHDE
jgi:hypothetical protein